MRRIITVGNFDGVHIGHRRLIAEAGRLAKRRGATVCAVTFDRMRGIRRGEALSTAAEKVRLLKKAGAREVRVLRGGARLWKMSAEDFARKILLPLNPDAVVAGYDFRFGRNKSAAARDLPAMLSSGGKRTRAVAVKIVSPLKIGGRTVSSSAIRALLGNGDVKKAADMLGRFYSAEGETAGGKKLAGRLGFPTINLKLPPEKLAPSGVFACAAAPLSRKRARKTGRARSGETSPKITGAIFPAVCYRGKSPTLLGLKRERLEVHLPGVAGRPRNGEVLKTKRWRIFFTARVRGEKTFSSREALKKQIKKDIILASSAPLPKFVGRRDIYKTG